MDFHELESFLALSETLHFARAAAQVHLSPSALSRLLNRLEEELGVSLFERDTRRVQLTKDGEIFTVFARETVHGKKDLLQILGKRDNTLRGIFRIYASVTACYSILPPFVETLSKEHPALRLSVETGDPADAADAVREGRVELALCALPAGGFKDLSSHQVCKTPLVFVTSKAGPYGSHRVQSTTLVEFLKSVPVLLPKTGLARERYDRWIRTHGVRPEITAESAGNEALLALARLGLGVALVPKLVLENGPFAEGLVQYEAGEDFGDYNIGFVQKPTDEGGGSTKRMKQAVSDIIMRTYPVV